MSLRPDFLFVPGAWHSPAYFEPLIAELNKRGCQCHSVATPSVGTKNPVESIEPDINAIATALNLLLCQEKSVIVVAHSYGGVCATAAVANVIMKRKDEEPRTGRIKRLVYVTSFVPWEGESLHSLQSKLPGPPPSAVPFRKFEGPWVSLNDYAKDALYHDVPEPMQSSWRQITSKHAVAALQTPVEEAGWRWVPTTYIYATRDRVLDVENQRWQVLRAKNSGLQESGIIAFDGELGEFSLDCGHTPFLGNRQEELRDILLRLATEG